MNNLEQIKELAKTWTTGNFDTDTKERVKFLLENDEKELIESFYQSLEFGTGGLRGIMGAGTNRMNIYTVGMSTQGLCNYLKGYFTNKKQIKVAIAYDCRNNSELFAKTAAKIFSANNIKVYLFDSLRPTPELSFAIRHFGCQSGIVVTASHNPKEYNGYKVYWEDGGQIIAPHDKNIVSEVRKITSIDEVNFNDTNNDIEIIGDELDEIYVNKIATLSLTPDVIKKQKDLKIVFTPIHGTGVKLVPMALKKIGFENIISVDEQNIVDGNFPTVVSPNPENQEALSMALKKANEVNADLLMATDPDADRVGIAIRDNNNKMMLLNGNQTAAILINYLISKWSEKGKLKGNEYIVKTIVTSEILVDIANKYNVEYYDVLTGFKYIADILKQNEGKKQFIGGGEESYGYLAGEFVRDKDAVMSCSLIAEIAANAKNDGKTMFDMLLDIYVEYGFYKENLVNLVKTGKTGAEEIQKMMSDFRTNPPKGINNSKVILIKDYDFQKEKDILTGEEKSINLPKSNVLQFFLEDGSKISVRPSGTEPKIKFYIAIKTELKSREDYTETNKVLDTKLENIKNAILNY